MKYNLKNYLQLNTIDKLKDLKNYYWVSRDGDIVSTSRGKVRSMKVKIDNGYRRIGLITRFGVRIFPVHRLVALAYINNINNKPFIDHINTIRGDNRVGNLRWVTQKENINNPISKKRFSESQKGRLNNNSKPKEHYSVKPTRRCIFKVACSNQGWDFNKFTQVESGEANKGNKKYYYKETI